MSDYANRTKARNEIACSANTPGPERAIALAILHLAEVIDARFDQVLDTQERVAVYDYSRRQGEREE